MTTGVGVTATGTGAGGWAAAASVVRRRLSIAILKFRSGVVLQVGKQREHTAEDEELQEEKDAHW